MNDIINKIHKLNLELDVAREKLKIALEGLGAISEFAHNTIARQTLHEIEKLDSND